MAKISYDDKVDSKPSPVPDINKVTASDMNMIKEAVNSLYDDLDGKVVKSVGGVGPDVDGDVSDVPLSAIYAGDSGLAGPGGYIHATNQEGTVWRYRYLVSDNAALNHMPRRTSEGNIISPNLAGIDSYTSHDNIYISRAYVKDQAPTLTLAPAQDVAEQFVYPRARIPEIGNGDKSWEYNKTIPISATSLFGESVSLHTARIPSYNTDGTYRGYGSVSATPASLAVPMYSTGSQLRVPLIPSNNDEATSKQYVDTQTANLATAPAADVTEKRYSVELVVPASGDGDPYFEYVEIP